MLVVDSILSGEHAPFQYDNLDLIENDRNAVCRAVDEQENPKC